MTKKYLKETNLVQSSPENTGLLPSDEWHVQNKRPINPLRTILNRTFTPKMKKECEGNIDVEYLEEHQEGIIEAYSNYYGEDWETILAAELEKSKDFLGTGLVQHGDKSPRSIHLSLDQWETYLTNGGYNDYCFSCEARPDIIVFDFDLKLTEDQLQKIEKTFNKELYVIEINTEKGTSHIYLQGEDDTAITKVKAGLKENKEDETPLDIDIFKGGLKHIACTTPSRKYKIIYDGNPQRSISTRKAITMLSKTLNYYLDKEKLEEILQPKQQQQKTTTTKATATGEIKVTSTSETDNERSVAIVENAIPIFTKLAGKGIREELYKGLAGALLRNGFNNAATFQIMSQIYEHTDDEDPRLTTVNNAIDRYQNGETTTGWKTFNKTVKDNKGKHRIGRNLQRLADAIFINKPPVERKLNPITEKIETSISIVDDGTVGILVNDEDQQFTELEETSGNEGKYIISNSYNDFKIIVDYEHKNIAKRLSKVNSKGEIIHEDTLIITAIPEGLEVYNDTICNTGRQYKCKWSFEDGTAIEVTGDIKLHYNTLISGAGVWNKNQLQNTISAVFGDLTRTLAHGTVVKNTPLQKGFYYDKENEEIIVVDHEIIRPTKEQLLEALILLDQYSSSFGYGYYNPDEPRGVGWTPNPDNPEEKMQIFKSDPTRLAVFLRWCLNAPFHFVRKQYGMTNDQYIFLTGESGVGKTYGYFMAGLFMLGVEEPKEFILSGGSNSKAQISKSMAKTTFPVLIDEADRVIGKEDITSLLKHSVQGINSRVVTDNDTKELVKEKALAQLGFSANNLFKDTEKGALTNRIVILPFYSKDVPTAEAKKRFENEFKTYYTPEDKRHILKWIGYEFQARVVEDPKIYIHTHPDQVVKQFFEDICYEVGYLQPLDWINNDIDKRTAEDERLERHETLKDIIINLLNKGMKFITYKTDPESYIERPLIETTITPEEKLLALAESCKVSWLRTNKRRDVFIINNGIIRAINSEDKDININTLEEFRDVLITSKYGLYDVKRYAVNEEGKTKQKNNSLKIDIEVFSDLYKVEE